jgi:hypothetical protein
VHSRSGDNLTAHPEAACGVPNSAARCWPGLLCNPLVTCPAARNREPVCREHPEHLVVRRASPRCHAACRGPWEAYGMIARGSSGGRRTDPGADDALAAGRRVGADCQQGSRIVSVVLRDSNRSSHIASRHASIPLPTMASASPRHSPGILGHDGLDLCTSTFAPCLLGCPGTPRHNPVSTARHG